MKGKMHFLVLIAVTTALALVLSGLGAISTSADSGSATLVYLLGTDFLCELDPSACPTVAIAPNGDIIEITGSGTLSIHSKEVIGEGDFTHKDADGNVLGGGTWTATQLLSFHSYGSGAVQGLPPDFEGGLALIRVHLSPGFDAILRVTCVLGDKIPASAKEGVRLNIQGGLNFNKEVSGFTVFIRQP